uniref:FMN hydroxy acid dehydrogenase domain-containing protein n=1 Tax=Mola mola TaxID=94237 RepID=A0A3Q3VZL8_MOLML
MNENFVCVSDFEEEARKVLPKSVYDYYHSGPEEQRTLADNIAAFNRYLLIHIQMTEIRRIFQKHKIRVNFKPGQTLRQRLVHPMDKTTRHKLTCQAVGIGMMLSSWATSTIEEVMSAMTAKSGTGGVLWLQLYIYKNRELILSLVQRAEEAGYKVIFVTVDMLYLGRRWDNMRDQFKLPPHLSMSNFSTASLAFSEENYGNNSGLAVYVAKAIDPTLCWDDITWLKNHTHLPLIVKGILNGEDAVQAVNYDVDGVVVSNHGARQLDGVPAMVCVCICVFLLICLFEMYQYRYRCPPSISYELTTAVAKLSSPAPWSRPSQGSLGV